MQSDESTTRTSARGRSDDDLLIRVPRIGRLMRKWLPEETVRHMRAAQREQLLAIRSLLDAAIERLEADEADERSARPHRVDVPVE